MHFFFVCYIFLCFTVCLSTSMLLFFACLSFFFILLSFKEGSFMEFACCVYIWLSLSLYSNKSFQFFFRQTFFFCANKFLLPQLRWCLFEMKWKDTRQWMISLWKIYNKKTKWWKIVLFFFLFVISGEKKKKEKLKGLSFGKGWKIYGKCLR